jgi:hypothetical protein
MLEVPERLRQMIETQVERLSEEEHRALEVTRAIETSETPGSRAAHCALLKTDMTALNGKNPVSGESRC